jgi:transcription antitermination factor NusG
VASSKSSNNVTAKKWVVVQLSSSAEKEKNISIFQRSVKRYLGKDLLVFVPAANLSARDDNHVMYYMDGYIFVEYQEGVNYNKLNETTYFMYVLSHPKTGVCLINDSEIDVMRKGMEVMKVGKFSKNDEVKVIRGSFKNLTGKISEVYEGGEFVQIDVGLLSKPLLIDYPANYLVKI